jgi:hypothetical protein
VIDSVIVRWPQGQKQTIAKVSSDQLLKANILDAKKSYDWQPATLASQPLFKEITKSKDINYAFNDRDIIDFNIQATLPHKLSEYRPALAVADVDGNGTDDIVIAGNSFSYPKLFLQQADGKFIQKGLSDEKSLAAKNSNDEGLLLFDANNDGSPDLYIASGGYNYKSNSSNYQDMLL